MGFSSFSLSPRAASRAAFSRTISVSRANLTSAAFSLTPVNSAARDSRKPSMFRVVLMRVDSHNWHAFVK